MICLFLIVAQLEVVNKNFNRIAARVLNTILTSQLSTNLVV